MHSRTSRRRNSLLPCSLAKKPKRKHVNLKLFYTKLLIPLVLAVAMLGILFGLGQIIIDMGWLENKPVIGPVLSCPGEECNRDDRPFCCKVPSVCGDTYGFASCVADPDYGNKECCIGWVTHPFPSPPAEYFCPPKSFLLKCEIIKSDEKSCTAVAKITCGFDVKDPPQLPPYLKRLSNTSSKTCYCLTGVCNEEGGCMVQTCRSEGGCPKGQTCLDSTCQIPPQLLTG